MSYFRQNIDSMGAYVPGEQPVGGAKVIKLNTNENPYPPSPAAMKVLRDFDADLLRRYPDAMATKFRNAVSKLLSVPPEWVIPGNGSDDIIMMIARACAGAGRTVAYPVPTFEFYFTQAQIEGARIVQVPFNEDFDLPVDALAHAGGAVTFIANPNSPSGTCAPVSQLDELARRCSGVIAIDEAYADFAGQSALELVFRHKNVIILRTLSKSYSLAGLRLGFGIADPELVEGLLKTKAIYNVDAIACAAGAAAIGDQGYKNDVVRKIVASRSLLTEAIRKLGYKVWDSQANFILVRPPDGAAERVYMRLKDKGILVRYYKQPALEDKLRITVGTDQQNEALVDALRAITGQP